VFHFRAGALSKATRYKFAAKVAGELAKSDANVFLGNFTFNTIDSYKSVNDLTNLSKYQI